MCIRDRTEAGAAFVDGGFTHLRAFDNAIAANGFRANADAVFVRFALVAPFELAVVVATIAVFGSAVVALLREGDYAISTSSEGSARLSGFATDEPRFNRTAVRTATVSIDLVAIVTGFVLGEDAVATNAVARQSGSADVDPSAAALSLSLIHI